MLNPDVIRTRADDLKQLIANGRGNKQKANVDRWLELDDQRRKLQTQLDDLYQEKNKLAELGKQGKIEEARTRGQEIREQIKQVETDLAAVKQEWQDILDWMPNLPLSSEDMPVGRGEDDNLVTKAWIPGGYLEVAPGTKAEPKLANFPATPAHAATEFTPQHHIDLGEKLGIIDNKQSAQVSGTRFTYLLGDAVLLQYGIQQLMFGELLRRDFIPVVPPLLVKERALYGSSHLPEGKDQIYRIEAENIEDGQQLYLVGSSEPTNFAYFMDRVLDHTDLPIKVFAYTPCFRSEAGSWGKDTKGIKRVHQFDKLEMNVVCLPEQSEKIFQELLSVNEWLLQQLELPYRLVQKCSGDAGYLASAKQVDAEVWLGGQQEFMEVGTDTNTTDYQARRLNIKFKNDDGSREFVHTVNDTGVAMGRMIIAILDNYQQADGTILVPKALQPFVGKSVIGPQRVRLQHS
jgi:seryl-tRNA synthetase